MSGKPLRSGRFRNEREADWQKLEGLLQRAERGGAKALYEDELIALPRLYRAALSSLSVARAISLDRAMIDYLESLCARAYFFVYGARPRLGKRVADFFARGWPAAAQALAGEALVAGLMMMAGAIAAFGLVLSDPDWFYSFIPEELAKGRTPAATTEYLRTTLFSEEQDAMLSAFATFLFTHNATVAILAFAVGFAFALPSLLLMVYNGCMLGALFAVFWMRGLGVELGGWLLIHGVTELLAITLAGAAGLHIGRAIAFPGRRTRLEAIAGAGREAATLMVGVVFMLFVAGLLEGVGRQMITSTEIRYSIAAASAAIWFAYLFLPRRNGAANGGR